MDLDVNLCTCIWNLVDKTRLVADPECRARHFGPIITYRLK